MTDVPATEEPASHEPAASAPTTCNRCGCEADGSARLTWSSAKGPRGTTWTCATCTRRHLRALEAKLDEEHW